MEEDLKEAFQEDEISLISFVLSLAQLSPSLFLDIFIILRKWGVKYRDKNFLPFSASRYQTFLTIDTEKH